MNQVTSNLAEEKIGYIFIRELDLTCPLVVEEDRILFMATSGKGPDHEVMVHAVVSALNREENSERVIKDWHWRSMPFPIPGIYASIFLPHKHQESPIKFLERASGFHIEERDPDRHLEQVHD